MPTLSPWLPGSTVAKAARLLLDQQFFCWGEDIKCPQGNLLCQFGFVRQRADESRAGCSRYHLTRAGGSEVVLWGGGFLLRGADGWGIVFQRTPFRPRLVAPGVDLGAAWTVGDVPFLGLPQSTEDAARLRLLLSQSFAFIARYEGWIIDAGEMIWRSESIARWWKPRTLAPDVASAWLRLSESAVCP